MASSDFTDKLINDFSPGFQTKRDPSDIVIGAAQSGQNIVISDGDKIKPIDGWELFGASDTSAVGVTSATNFALTRGLEIPIRASGTVLEYYNEGTEAWENLNSGYTTGLRFGFTHFYDSAFFKDYIYFANGTEAYSRWDGAYSQLNGALSGGETEVVVDSTLDDRVHFSGTAASVTTTTLTITFSDWATDIYNDIYYVRITDGAQSGKVSLITDTTSTVITFAAIAGLSGTPTFEIRQAKFADSGNIRIGTDTIAYTSIDQDDRFAGCSNVQAASDNAAMSQSVTTYPENPRVNILFTLNERVYAAHDEEAALHITATGDATDFTFSVTRVAGEGDLGIIPEGGGPIKGFGISEDKLVILKRNILKETFFTRDELDLFQLSTLLESNGVGTEAPKSVFPVDNELYYASPEGGVKAVSRVPDINFVQALQIADPIRPTMNTAVFDDAAGVFFDGKAFIAAKSNSNASANDIVFVYNFQKKSWELPIIGLNASDFFIYNNDLYASSSQNVETFKLNTGVTTIKEGITEFPIKCSWTSGNINFASPANRKAFNMFYVEGYISTNTIITVKLSFEYNGVYRELTGTIDGSDETYLLVSGGLAALGEEPLGVVPLGAGVESPPLLNKFRIYLTTNEIPFYEHSITFETDGISQNWEILRAGPNAIGINQIDPSIKKSLV
jgi:hypothetical protein